MFAVAKGRPVQTTFSDRFGAHLNPVRRRCQKGPSTNLQHIREKGDRCHGNCLNSGIAPANIASVSIRCGSNQMGGTA